MKKFLLDFLKFQKLFSNSSVKWPFLNFSLSIHFSISLIIFISYHLLPFSSYIIPFYYNPLFLNFQWIQSSTYFTHFANRKGFTNSIFVILKYVINLPNSWYLYRPNWYQFAFQLTPYHSASLSRVFKI